MNAIFCCCDLQNKKCHDRHVFRINSSVLVCLDMIGAFVIFSCYIIRYI